MKPFMAQVRKVTMKLVILPLGPSGTRSWCVPNPTNWLQLSCQTHSVTLRGLKMHQVRRKSNKRPLRLDGNSLRNLRMFQQRGMFSFPAGASVLGLTWRQNAPKPRLGMRFMTQTHASFPALWTPSVWTQYQTHPLVQNASNI